MTSRSDPRPGLARTADGFTLMETLVALGILALVLGVSATALRGPSPAMQLERAASELIARATAARARAVASGDAVSVDMPGCGDAPVAAIFYPDGTALGLQACLRAADLGLTLRISPLTGRLSVVRAP